MENRLKKRSDCRQQRKKLNTRCPHNAKFPLVEIDVSVNQILNPFPSGIARSLAKHKCGVRTDWLIFFLFCILFRNRNLKCPYLKWTTVNYMEKRYSDIYLKACFRRRILSCLMQFKQKIMQRVLALFYCLKCII